MFRQGIQHSLTRRFYQSLLQDIQRLRVTNWGLDGKLRNSVKKSRKATEIRGAMSARVILEKAKSGKGGRRDIQGTETVWYPAI